MDLTTFNRRKAELFVKYTDLYEHMKKNGASFAERREVAFKLALLKEMKAPPSEIPPIEMKKLYRDTATLIWFQLPKKDLKEFAEMVKDTLTKI